jgi:hypothetical protein
MKYIKTYERIKFKTPSEWFEEGEDKIYYFIPYSDLKLKRVALQKLNVDEQEIEKLLDSVNVNLTFFVSFENDQSIGVWQVTEKEYDSEVSSVKLGRHYFSEYEFKFVGTVKLSNYEIDAIKYNL